METMATSARRVFVDTPDCRDDKDSPDPQVPPASRAIWAYPAWMVLEDLRV